MIDLFLNWKESKDEYSLEMANTLDRIINSVLKPRTGAVQLYYKTEDFEDLLQDIRFICLKRLANVKPPYTNKRLFNYLALSIKLYLKEKTRNTCRKLDKEKVEHHLTPTASGIDTSPFFLEPDLDKVLSLRMAGFSWVEVKDKLAISSNELQRRRQEMEKRFNEKNAV